MACTRRIDDSPSPNKEFAKPARQPRPHFATDEEGHYDIDGVSYACNQVIIASDAQEIRCSDWKKHLYPSKSRS